MLTAKLPNKHGARLTITNYPKGGPIFSGPQIQPWLCTTDANGLGPAQDAQCNAPTTYEFFYMPTTGAGFQPYDPASPPADVATTTTDQGNTVPYVIRQETGTENRGIYRIAVLSTRRKPFEPWASQPGWNHKLFYPFGASCGTIHSQSDAQDVQNDFALSRGFMVATSSMNVLGNNCNDVTSAESVLMLKERIVERYGEIRYTMANGCSGGSIGQHMSTTRTPGLVHGIQPNCSYEDNTTTGIEVEDCHLLFDYFTLTSPQLWADRRSRRRSPARRRSRPARSGRRCSHAVDDPQRRLRRSRPTRTTTPTRTRRAAAATCATSRSRSTASGRRALDRAGEDRRRLRQVGLRQRRHPVRARGAAPRARSRPSSSST